MSKSHSFWSVLALVLVAGLGGCLPSELFSTPTPTPTPVRPRQIAKNTLGLREYWRVPHTCLGASSSSLAATSGRVVCLYYDPASNGQNIRVFEVAHGTLLWKAVGQPGSGLVAVDSKRVYFESHLELHTYDLENGQQLWEMPLTGHRGHLYNPRGEKLYILESGPGGVPWMLYTLDARTGDTLNCESVSTDDGFILFARFPQFDLYYGLMPQSALRAVDPVTHQVRWQVKEPKIFSTPNWPPILLDDVLLIDPGEAVIAFDAQSGQVRWRSGDPTSIDLAPLFATKSVVMDGSLYALRYDGRLVRLNPKTGQETGYIQFVPALPNHSPISEFFALATDGKMLFVSFDDSNELIALGP